MRVDNYEVGRPKVGWGNWGGQKEEDMGARHGGLLSLGSLIKDSEFSKLIG